MVTIKTQDLMPAFLLILSCSIFFLCISHSSYSNSLPIPSTHQPQFLPWALIVSVLFAQNVLPKSSQATLSYHSDLSSRVTSSEKLFMIVQSKVTWLSSGTHSTFCSSLNLLLLCPIQLFTFHQNLNATRAGMLKKMSSLCLHYLEYCPSPSR